MTVQCPLCRSAEQTILLELRLNIYRCNSCLHTFTNAPREKQEKYEDDYFLETHRAWFNNPNFRLFGFILGKATAVLDKEPLRLLEIGCGKGDFLKYIKARDASAKLLGIDLVHNEHPGIQFIKGSFYDLEENQIDTKFNIVCGLAVIEHVDDLHLFMQKASNLLELGGLLFIMTVNNDGLIYRIARLLNKIGLHAPFNRLYSLHHLHHFTNRSLQHLMTMSGFDVLLKKNHNFPIKAVDVPESGFLIEKAYKALVGLIFLLSSAVGAGMLQTIVCRKRNPYQDRG